MTARRRPKSTPQPEVVPAVQFSPGDVLRLPDASGNLELRLAMLEGMFDLMATRLAFTESSLECALERIRLLQNQTYKDLLGI